MGKGKENPRLPFEWTRERDDEIRAAYEKGERVKGLAERWGVQLYKVYQRADELGLKSRKYFTTKEIEYLRTYYPTPKPVDDIATELGRSKQSIHNMASDLGLKRPRHWAKRFTKEEEQAIVRLYTERKKSVSWIAAKCGASFYVIRELLQANGVEVLNQSEATKKNYEFDPSTIPFPELYRLYFVECWTHKQIQRHYKIAQKKFNAVLDHYHIPARRAEERRAMREEFKHTERTFRKKKGKNEDGETEIEGTE